MQSQINFEPIGRIESCYKDKFGIPRQSGLVPEALSYIKLFPHVQPEDSLKGLQGFSHLWIIWFFHKNNVARYHSMVHPPRLEGESMGVFATRTPHRPNPIGLSLVKISRIDATGVWFEGADMLDQTPVLDLKPYLVEHEAQTEALSGWAGSSQRQSLQVSWSAQAEKDLTFFQQRHREFNLQSMITKSITLDPRPEAYRHERWSKRVDHAFRVLDFDVHFNMKSEAHAEVTQLLDLSVSLPGMK